MKTVDQMSDDDLRLELATRQAKAAYEKTGDISLTVLQNLGTLAGHLQKLWELNPRKAGRISESVNSSLQDFLENLDQHIDEAAHHTKPNGAKPDEQAK